MTPERGVLPDDDREEDSGDIEGWCRFVPIRYSCCFEGEGMELGDAGRNKEGGDPSRLWPC